MAQILPWVALILSALVLAYGAVRGTRPKGGGLLPFAGAGAGLVLLTVLATLPKSPPWSPAQGLWPGLLLGGGAVLAAALLAERLGSETDRALAGAVELAAPVLGVSVLLLAYPGLRGTILDAYGGFILGALGAGILLAGRGLGEREEAPAAGGAAVPAVALGLATLLALMHQSPAGVREWMPLPALLGGTAAAALTVRSALGRGGLIPSLAAVILPVGIMAWLIGYRLEGRPGFLTTVLVSLALFGMLAWLGRLEQSETPGFRPDTGLLASLLVLGGGALAYRGLHGYGLALAGLCGALVARLAGRDVSGFVERGVVLVLLLAAYRAFTELNEYTSGFQPDFLYFYVALVGGALLPALLAGSVFRWTPAAGGRVAAPGALVRVGLTGAAAALAPLAAWVLVGERPQAALLVGLAVGAGFLLSRQATGARVAGEAQLAGLAALAAAWSAVQFTRLLEPLALATRPQRITLLAVIGVIALVIIGVTAVLERRAPAASTASAE